MSRRIAQMDPMGGMPPMGGDPMGGMPPPPGAPPPGGPQPPDRQPIVGPLDSIGKVLYDCNIEKEIAANPNRSEEEIAEMVWTQYGGSEDGGVVKGKVGQRDESDAEKTPDQVAEDNKKSEDQKWVRLPRGKNIADITSLEELTGMMKDLTYGTMKKFKAPAAPPGGAPGGGMPPMAARSGLMVRTSEFVEMAEAVEKVRKRSSS